MDKIELRRILLEKRRQYNKDTKQKSDEKIFKNLINLSEYKSASAVFCYVSTEIEVDTLHLIEYSLKIGKIVAVPKCSDNNGNMVFKRINNLSELEKGYFNILEPKEACPEYTDYNNSICIVPALAFDKNGYRIGYGKGYYDRFLQIFNGYSIGLCYNDFVLEKLPIDLYDKYVNRVISENAVAIKSDDSKIEDTMIVN